MSLLHARNRIARQRPGVMPRQRPHVATRRTMQMPVLGWNTVDAVSDMKPGYAVALDNFFPVAGRCRLRRGYTQHNDGLGTSTVRTVFSHASGTVEKLYGIAGGVLYDCTTLGSTTTELTTGLTNDNWQHASFGGHTILVNGADDPMRIEPAGTLASAHGWSGTNLTPSDLIQVLPFKARLFFVEKDSGSIWYGDAAAIQGTLTEFPVSRIHKEGGTVLNIGTLTVDGGTGPDDLLCIFMSSGAVIVYSGVDISDSASWGLVGIFDIGRLVGKNGLVKFGGDLIAITADGFVPVSTMLRAGREGGRRTHFSNKIASAVTEAVDLYDDQEGWQAILHTPANWLLFNIPAGNAPEQFVMNTHTGAWCRFRDIPAYSWARFDDRIFFGGTEGTVYEAHKGNADDGASIVGDLQTAYHYFGTQMNKRATVVKPLFEASANVSVAVGISTDFGTPPTLGGETVVGTPGQLWGTFTWDTWTWGTEKTVQSVSQEVAGTGAAISLRARTTTRNAEVSIFSADVSYLPMVGVGVES